MKVWLDDERPAPEGWHRCYWPAEVTALLKTGKVEAMSLDHDLGDDERGTGYDVLRWLEQHVWETGMKPPRIKIHTANPSARVKMTLAKRQIHRIWLRKLRELAG